MQKVIDQIENVNTIGRRNVSFVNSSHRSGSRNLRRILDGDLSTSTLNDFPGTIRGQELVGIRSSGSRNQTNFTRIRSIGASKRIAHTRSTRRQIEFIRSFVTLGHSQLRTRHREALDIRCQSVSTGILSRSLHCGFGKIRNVTCGVTMCCVRLSTQSVSQPFHLTLSQRTYRHDSFTIHRNFGRCSDDTSYLCCSRSIRSVGIHRHSPCTIGFQELVLITNSGSRNQTITTSTLRRSASKCTIGSSFRQFDLCRRAITFSDDNLLVIFGLFDIGHIGGDVLFILICRSFSSFRHRSSRQIQIGNIRDCVGMLSISLSTKSGSQSIDLRLLNGTNTQSTIHTNSDFGRRFHQTRSGISGNHQIGGFQLVIQCSLEIGNVTNGMGMHTSSFTTQSVGQTSHFILRHSSDAHRTIASHSDFRRSFNDTSCFFSRNRNIRSSFDNRPCTVGLQELILITLSRSGNQTSTTSSIRRRPSEV